jgi:F-type H+-transporting ATPase subunit b
MTLTGGSRLASRSPLTGMWSGAVAMLSMAAGPVALAAQEAEAAAEGGGGMFDVNVGLTIWTIVVFLVLLVILGKFAWKPILDQARTREERIQGALDEAARLNAEAAALLEQHKAQLADARRQAQEIVNEGKTAGERVRKDIEEKARAEGQAMVERAKKEIEREKDAALDEIRKESVDLALAVASRLMKEKLDGEQDRKLVTGYLDELTRQGATAGGKRA